MRMVMHRADQVVARLCPRTTRSRLARPLHFLFSKHTKKIFFVKKLFTSGSIQVKKAVRARTYIVQLIDSEKLTFV
jgi:hypothetical protein